jgi:outer membrane protein assembly factor BamB
MGSWPQFHHDSRHSGWSTAQHVLDAASVQGLHTPYWWSAELGPVLASPAVGEDGIVYVAPAEGGLFALKLSPGASLKNALRWEKPVPGIVSSPALSTEFVYGYDGLGNVYCVHVENGTVAWRVTVGQSKETQWVNEPGGEQYPLVYPVVVPMLGGDPALQKETLFVGGPGYLHSFGVVNGKAEAILSLHPADDTVTSPAVFGRSIYVACHSKDPQVDVIRAYNLRGAVVRETPIDQVIHSSLTVADGVVYAVWLTNGKFQLHAFDRLSLNKLQSWNPPNLGQKPVDTTIATSTPAVADGVVYVGTLDGHLHAYDAKLGDTQTASGLPWQVQVGDGSEIHTSPAVANGLIYIGSDDGHVYAYDISGHLQGTFPTNDPPNEKVRSSPAVANGAVYFGSGTDDVGGLYVYGQPTN